MIELKDDHVNDVKRGSIYWYDFKTAILPVLVIQNNTGNKYSDFTIIIKMNSSESLKNKKDRIPTIVNIQKHEIVSTPKKAKGLKEDGYLLTSDIFTIPKNTLKSYIGFLLPSSFPKVEKALKISLGITYEKELSLDDICSNEI